MKRKLGIFLLFIALLATAGCQSNSGISESDTNPTPALTSEVTLTPEATSAPAPTNTPTPVPTNTPTPVPTNTPTPTPGFTIRDLAHKEYWTTANVNMRTRPNTTGTIIICIPKGEKVLVIGQCNETAWYQVSYHNTLGFVCNDYVTDVAPAKPTATPTPTPTPVPSIEELTKAALLIRCSDNRTLYDYNEHLKLPPASITKLMTALLAFENGRMTDVLTASQTALDVGDPEATMCGFKLGDQISLQNVLCGMLLWSGNDAAEMVAEYLAGDVDAFSVQMNKRAAELGMTSTNFCNPHGLPDDAHLTTAYDISLLMKELLPHKALFTITNNEKLDLAYHDANGQAQIKTVKTTNYYCSGKKELPEGLTLLGIKTGFTRAAGRCLAMYVEDSNGEIYIAEIFGAKDQESLYLAMEQLLKRIQ